jgi:hypothetical protein
LVACVQGLADLAFEVDDLADAAHACEDAGQEDDA